MVMKITGHSSSPGIGFEEIRDAPGQPEGDLGTAGDLSGGMGYA